MQSRAPVSAGVDQGESRAIPRWTVTVLLVLACARLTAMLLFDAPGPRTRTHAPVLLRLPFEVPPLAVLLAAPATFALIQFGRRRGTLGWGAVAMALLAYLSASQAVLTGNDERDLYICGALLTGWLFGVLFGRRLDRKLARASDPDRDDEVGEAGARGAFVAVYLGACTSKLLEAGGSWLDGRNLLSHVVSQHEFTGGVLDQYLMVVLDHPRLADVFAAATLFIQAGMLLYLVGPRLRMLWAGLVIGFHLNAYLLMGVKYFNPIFAALALSYPWPRILRRLRGAPAIQPGSAASRSEAEPGALGAVAWQATGWVVLAGVAAVVVWWGVHARDSTSLFVERPHELPHQP